MGGGVSHLKLEERGSAIFMDDFSHMREGHVTLRENYYYICGIISHMWGIYTSQQMSAR